MECFPDDFIFRLTQDEWINMSSHFVMTSSNKRPKNALPYAFTEHGVSMLASVLKSEKARQMNISVVRAFIALRKFVIQYADIMNKIEELKERVGGHDTQLNLIYNAVEKMLDEKMEEKKWENRERIGFMNQ
jgi:hypothetical protein